MLHCGVSVLNCEVTEAQAGKQDLGIKINKTKKKQSTQMDLKIITPSERSQIQKRMCSVSTLEQTLSDHWENAQRKQLSGHRAAVRRDCSGARGKGQPFLCELTETSC